MKPGQNTQVYQNLNFSSKLFSQLKPILDEKILWFAYQIRAYWFFISIPK